MKLNEQSDAVEGLNLTVQGMLAKLLAKENVRVQHGNYQTAFFDVKTRTLGLPIWKDEGKAVYDLLVGHEVGHALYTPASGIERFRTEMPNVPFDVCNIVEDIRIERIIQDTYPGLIAAFREAYGKLTQKDFFGLNGKDLNTLGFLDRLNIHAKAGAHISVPMNAEELDIFNRCRQAQTFDDVIEMCKIVAKYAKDHPPQQPPQSNSNDANDDGDTQNDSSEQQIGNDNNVMPDENTEEQSNDASQSSDSDEDADAQDANQQASSDSAEHSPDPLTSETLANFEKALSQNVVNLSDSTVIFQEPSLSAIQRCVVSYEDVMRGRSARLKYAEKMASKEVQDDFIEFMKRARQNVNTLKKEFDMRKAAFQYSRARQSTTGTLNMNRLHSFKFNDDIFKSVTQLANAKNHGMMMFVDYSSSMNTVLPRVIDQTIYLALFCKSLSIPFEVYGFTTSNTSALNQTSKDEINLHSTSIINLLSSTMSKSTFELAIRQWRAQAFLMQRGLTNSSGVTSLYEHTNGTPLNEVAIVAHHLVNKFRKANPVQKMNVVFLTDGDGGQVTIGNYCLPWGKTIGVLNGQKLDINHRDSNVDGSNNAPQNAIQFRNIINHLRKTTGSTVVGFFIPTNKDMARRAIVRWIEGNKAVTYTQSYTKNSCVTIPHISGYDSMHIFPPVNEIHDTEDEFEYTPDDDVDFTRKSAQNTLAKAFGKFTSDRRSSRMILSEFAETIA